MQMQDFTYQSRDHLLLFAHVETPATEARGVVALLHGLGEYGGRYLSIANVFTDRDYAFVAGDLRGHGRSQGRRAFAPRLDSFLDDFDRYLGAIRRRFPGVPLFLYAFSMGAPLAAAYLARRHPDVAGAVLVSGVYQMALPSQVKALSHILPTLAVANSLGPRRAMVCHDVSVLDAYDADPLVYRKVTVGLAEVMTEAGQAALAQAADISVPVLLMHGDADIIAPPTGSQQLAAAMKGDVTLKLWPGLYHFLHFEPGAREQVLPFAVDWMDQYRNR